MKPIPAALLCAALFTSMIGCVSDDGIGPQSPTGGNDAIVGTWTNTIPTYAPDEIDDTRSRVEVSFLADGSAQRCRVGVWKWKGAAWVDSAYTPRCARNGKWDFVTPSVFHWSDEWQDEKDGSWEPNNDYVGFEVQGDSLYNWSVRLWAGAGPLVGTEFRNAEDPDIEYRTLKLTADGKMIRTEYYEGEAQYADTSRYTLDGADRIVQFVEWSATPDTILVTKVGAGFIFTELEEVQEAYQGDDALVRKR